MAFRDVERNTMVTGWRACLSEAFVLSSGRGHLAVCALHLPQLSPVPPCHALHVRVGLVEVTTGTFAFSESWSKLSHASLCCFELILKALGL